MPEKKTMARARKSAREGKAPSTQAGEFVREEIHHVRGGKHGAKNAKQAIAIGLSKARRAGVKLPAPKKGSTSAAARKKANRDLEKAGERPSPKRSRARKRALKRAPRTSASSRALSRQARSAAQRRKRTAASTPRRGSTTARRGARSRSGGGARGRASHSH